ncbi:MAG: hypothetical protein HRT37_17140 [Alteromonadaceae bacterium]|nr:hypothetical protein [Alteromonadaceae bacterium]
MDTPVSTVITVNGKEIKDHPLIAVNCRYKLNEFPEATLTFNSGSTAERKFTASEDAAFVIGAEVVVKLGYQGEGGKEQSVFEGVIVATKLTINDATPQFEITVTSPAITTVTGEKTQLFAKDTTDDKAIKKVLTDASVKVSKVDATKTKHLQLVQLNQSDWDFVKDRARQNGLMLLFTPGKLAIVSPATHKGKKHTLEFGKDAIDNLTIESDATSQLASASITSYDVKKQDKSPAVKAKAMTLKGGKLNQKKAAEALKRKDWLRTLAVPEDKDMVTGLGSGALNFRMLDLYHGKIVIPGKSGFAVGDILTLKALDKNFSGEYFIGQVHQQITTKGWRTQLTIGSHFGPTLTQVYRPERKQSGVLLGVVSAYEKDKEGLFRYKVKVPALGAKNNEIWARHCSPFASKEIGVFLPPKASDEVVISFLDGNFEHPIIVGSLYNPKNKPPFPFDDKLEKSGLVFTKDEHALIHDSKEISLTVIGAKKSTIVWDKKGVMTTTVDKSKIVIDKAIDLDSGDGINLSAKKDVVIKTSAKCNIQASKTEIK